jgi:hypothetical protein
MRQNKILCGKSNEVGQNWAQSVSTVIRNKMTSFEQILVRYKIVGPEVLILIKRNDNRPPNPFQIKKDFVRIRTPFRDAVAQNREREKGCVICKQADREVKSFLWEDPCNDEPKRGFITGHESCVENEMHELMEEMFNDLWENQ